jgi:integrase
MKSLKTRDPKEAEERLGAIENTLRAIHEGRLKIPPEAEPDPWTFISTDGRLATKPVVTTAPARDVLTLEKLFDKYVEMLPPGALAANSLGTNKLHFKHLMEILGKDCDVQKLTATDLQGYVNKRMKQKYRDKTPRPKTIRMETSTMGTVWEWAVLHKLVDGPNPVPKLRYEKAAEEKLPFMTWAEIERRASVRGLTQEQIDELWDCLFLDVGQIAELLEYVKEHASFAFIYPMFVFVAHTGARRSEMMRSQIMDLDFEAGKNGEVALREKKRVKDKRISFRRVPMTTLFRSVTKEWLERHPGGTPYTFCQVSTRIKKRDTPEPLTINVARHHFDHTLADSKWKVLRGFHVFRHSFASNHAAAGTDQRLINKWLGHETEEMEKRYRHMFPHLEHQAVASVYG